MVRVEWLQRLTCSTCKATALFAPTDPAKVVWARDHAPCRAPRPDPPTPAAGEPKASAA